MATSARDSGARPLTVTDEHQHTEDPASAP
jgi:hypothetical protein